MTQPDREARRHRAIEALARGHSQKEVAAMLETSVASVSQWKTRFQRSGAAGIAAKPQGRPSRAAAGSPLRHVAALLAMPPEAHGLADPVWDNGAVATLIARATGTRVSRWTVLRHLDSWGMTPPAIDARALLTGADHGRTTTIVVQSGLRESATDGPDHWLLWGRRPRGDTGLLVLPHRPTAPELQDFVRRLLVRWPARSRLAAAHDDAVWTLPVLSACAARWPDHIACSATDGRRSPNIVELPVNPS